MECQTPGPARMSEKVAFGLSERQRATEKEAMACCGFCINYGCTHPYTHGHRTLSLSLVRSLTCSLALSFSLSLKSEKQILGRKPVTLCTVSQHSELTHWRQ